MDKMEGEFHEGERCQKRQTRMVKMDANFSRSERCQKRQTRIVKMDANLHKIRLPFSPTNVMSFYIFRAKKSEFSKPHFGVL